MLFNSKIKLLIVWIFLSTLGCSEVKTENFSKTSEKSKCELKENHYDSLTIPLFFKSLVSNHIKNFHIKDSITFHNFCKKNKVLETDSSNINRYFTISILHELFTSQTASNCSRGGILNIPYLWHWVNPNPRHGIYFTRKDELLANSPPPQGFSNYNSYADLDRTPYIFLSDLVHPESKYYSSSCDTFPTFGWCSEREMAFVALTTLLGFDGKVVAEGNHSWSEYIIPLISTDKNNILFQVTIDNTFDQTEWRIISPEDTSSWKQYFGNTNLSRWYNTKAKSKSELQKIQQHKVPDSIMSDIEKKVLKFLETQLDKG